MDESTSKLFKPTARIYIRTTLLVTSWFLMGIYGEIIGPTIGILAHNVHVTFNGIATALAARSAGSLLTNVLCGIFQNLVQNHSDVLLVIAFFVSTIILSVTPLIRSLVLMSIVFFVQGVAGSCATMGGTNLVLKMWQSRAATPLNIVHMGYGCGAIFANLLVRSFLNNTNFNVNATESIQFNTSSLRSISVPLNVDIRIPYLIAAGLCFLNGIGHLVFAIQGQKDTRNTTEKQKVNHMPVNTTASKTDTHTDAVKFAQYSPATCGHGYFEYGLLLSLNFIAYMFFVMGTEQMFAKFYFSYLKFDKFGITTQGASSGIILFWLSFTIGRLTGAIACIFISVNLCLAIIWCGGLLLSTMWLVYVWILGLTVTSLFILGSFTGFLLSPLIPLSFAWINQKLNMIPSLLAAILCGCGSGSLILQKIAGFVMDRDPNHFPTLLTICAILTIVLYIVSNFIIFFHQRNLKNHHSTITNDASITNEDEQQQQQQLVNCLQSVTET